MTTSEQQARIELVTSGLLEFGGRFTRGTFPDVYAWFSEGPRDYSQLTIALLGNALKVSAMFGMLGGDGVPLIQPRWISDNLKHVFKLKESGFEYDHSVGLPDFLDKLGGQTLGMIDAPDPFTETSVVFMADPGYPWGEKDEPITYWSAKKRRWVTPERPAWLVQVEDQDDPKKMRLGVNPCAIFPPDESKTAPGGAVFGRAKGGVEIMVAHSMTLAEQSGKGSRFHKFGDVAVENIKACGGLLFPSLSVGPVPASNFGPISLIAHLDLVLGALKPYRGRGRNPAWVYDTDAWTVGTGELMKYVAAQLFDELHQGDDWMYGRHMWVLGPPGELHGGPKGDQTPLDTTSQLVRGIKRRMKPWHRDLDVSEFNVTDTELAGTDAKYAYCEAKTREVVRLDEFPYIVAPETYRERVESFANGLDYRGEIILLPDEYDMLTAEEVGDNFTMYSWAWQVADAVKKLRPIVDVR